MPYQLIGRRVEVRETKDEILIFDGPRLVAKHRRLQGPGKQRVTEPKHRPPRGGGAAARPVPPDEKELREAEPPLPEYAAKLKVKSTTRWPLALRRLVQMWRDYPRGPFLDAVTEAIHYGLYDVDRLERMVLRHIAHDYFVLTDHPTKEPEDEG